MRVFVVIREYTPYFGGDTNTTVERVFASYGDALAYCQDNVASRVEFFIEEMPVL